MQTTQTCEQNGTRNVAIVMHCNLKPPYTVPVVLCFNYDVHTKVQVKKNQFIAVLQRFPADTLCNAVTLIFDPEHWWCIASDIVKLCTKF